MLRETVIALVLTRREEQREPTADEACEACDCPWHEPLATTPKSKQRNPQERCEPRPRVLVAETCCSAEDKQRWCPPPLRDSRRLVVQPIRDDECEVDHQAKQIISGE